jgi:transposase-like protein
MPEKRRKFSPQFKAEAVQMVIETGKPVAEGARVRVSMTGRWAIGWQRGAMRILSRRRRCHRSSVPA